MQGAQRTAGKAAAVVAAGVALAVLGPFGTGGDFSVYERYGYWLVLTLLMWLQDEAVLAAARRWPRFCALRRWTQAAAAALAGAIPTTFEVAYAEGLLRVGGVLTPRSLFETYWSVALISVGVFVPLVLIAERTRVPPVALTSFAKALPAGLGSHVRALAAEDHYLRVFTERGEALIHHRFSDAVRELGSAGAQVHRSWWVAKGAVEALERERDRYVLVLAGGLRVPVSRTYGLAARQAGLVPERD